MATNFQNPVRRVVPRWRSLQDALGKGELDPLRSPPARTFDAGDFLAEKEQQWKETNQLTFALDFINAALVLGVTAPAREAAHFVLDHRHEITGIAASLAEQVAGVEAEREATPQIPEINNREATIGAIRKHKARSIVEPRNAFVWAELARLYSLLGMPHSAERPMRIALGLAPQDRFVMRSASRFLLHVGKPDEALQLLRRSGMTRTDPWLMAAELAVSSVLNKSPSLWKEASRALASGSFSPFHLSEMKTAMASIELWDGRNKKAKELFFSALKDPTENALAQVVWASKEVDLLAYPFSTVQVAGAFEADALDARNRGNWEETVQNCALWAADESFSSRPYGLGSAVSVSILQKPEDALVFARKGLDTNPDHPGLLNNIAFSLVENDQPREAKLELAKADFTKADDQAKACILATGGLIEYRLGDGAKGRDAYEKTLLFATQHNNRLLKATAQMYMAREEIRLGNREYLKLFHAGNDSIQKSGDAYAKAVANCVWQQIDSMINPSDKG